MVRVAALAPAHWRARRSLPYVLVSSGPVRVPVLAAGMVAGCFVRIDVTKATTSGVTPILTFTLMLKSVFINSVI